MDSDVSQILRDPKALDHLLEVFARHVLALLILAPSETPNKPTHLTFTGSIVTYRGFYFWLTAGHVVQELLKIRGAFGSDRITAKWYDEYGSRAASGIPVSLHDAPCLELHSKGIDLGFVLLRPNEVQLILANCNREFLSPNVWLGTETLAPDAFFLVGFPSEESRIDSISQEGRHLRIDADFALTCLEIERVDVEDRRHENSFWHKDNSFYGRLVDFDRERGCPRSIVGMSGGPIFSFTKCGDEHRYHLFAVQSHWLESEHAVRGVPIQLAEAMMEGVYQYFCKSMAD